MSGRTSTDTGPSYASRSISPRWFNSWQARSRPPNDRLGIGIGGLPARGPFAVAAGETTLGVAKRTRVRWRQVVHAHPFCATAGIHAKLRSRRSFVHKWSFEGDF